MPVIGRGVRTAASAVDARPTAVGCYVFAGGFTLGVSDHFRVLAHLEDGPFGVATATRNFPGLEVHQDPGSWPTTWPGGGPDLVYCNPPCAPWSTAGVVPGQTSEEQADWRSHSQVSCVARAFSLLRTLRPRVWCFESVRQVYTRASAMLDDMAAEAASLGYSVTDLFTSAEDHGVPQRRRRYFMVVHRVEVPWSAPEVRPRPTVDEALAKAASDPHEDMTISVPPSVAAACHLAGQGENVRMAWDRAQGTPSADGLGNRPAFLYDRLTGGSTASYTILGSCNKLHPREDRMITVNETKALCGFPPRFELVGSTAARYAQLGKGVCPPVARWLASCLARAVSEDVPVAAVRRAALTATMGLLEEGPPVAKKKTTRKTPEVPPVTAPVRRTPPRPVARRPVQVSRETVDPPPVEEAGAATTSPPPAAPRTVARRFTPPGKRVGDLDRRFDKTQLKASSHGYTVHRDYAAHFFRWGFAFKRIVYQETRVLDVGCGQDCPLARVLSFRQAAVPALWVGVDLNKIDKPFRSSWARVHDQFSFVDRHAELAAEYGAGSFDLAVNFEMIEHMHPPDGLRLLRNVADLVRPGGELVLSTPVYNGRKMAANHLHEYGVDELRDLIGESGRWRIRRRFGTFASWTDIKKVMTSSEVELYEELGQYYDHEVLACFLAPKYPDASRNNVWVLSRLDD